MNRNRQLDLALPQRGGRRAGSGRKTLRPRPPRPHRRREAFRPYQPVHVTIRMADHVWNLRSQRSFAVVHGAVRDVRARDDFRVVHFTILGNHLHPRAARGVALRRRGGPSRGRTVPARVAEALVEHGSPTSVALPRATEADRLVVQRVGQDVFRSGLLE